MLNRENGKAGDIYRVVFILLNFFQTGGNNPAREFFLWIKERNVGRYCPEC